MRAIHVNDISLLTSNETLAFAGKKSYNTDTSPPSKRFRYLLYLLTLSSDKDGERRVVSA